MPPEGGGSRALLGYALVAVGAADILAAVILLLREKPEDPRVRKLLAGTLGFSGLAMIAAGALLWLGVLGRG